jgi:hypothetical protein
MAFTKASPYFFQLCFPDTVNGETIQLHSFGRFPFGKTASLKKSRMSQGTPSSSKMNFVAQFSQFAKRELSVDLLFSSLASVFRQCFFWTVVGCTLSPLK